jgi:NAD(P)-dependent dehydrogenase (short-subunit alcohol dehydrogenase family)
MTVVVITDGTRGIGRNLASAFLDGGCRVVVCGRDPDAVRAADDLDIQGLGQRWIQ